MLRSVSQQSKNVIVQKGGIMKFLAGVILGIFSITLILVQSFFITWSLAYPQVLFFITTIISILITIILLIQSKSEK